MAVTELLPINVEEFTNNVQRDDIEHIVTGDGIFDKLMETATQHLKAQFEGNRLREEDYASAYIQIYQATLQATVQLWLQKGLAQKQLDLVAKQIETEDAKRALYRRQIEGFDENFKEKVMKMLLDAWGIGFSVGGDAFTAANIPAAMTKTVMDDVFTQYVMKDLDSYKYDRISDTITEIEIKS